MTIRDTNTAENALVMLENRTANLPAWILIQPTNTDRPIVTDEPDHFLHTNMGQAGVPKQLVDTARSFLSGNIGHAEVGAAVQDALMTWSSLARQSRDARSEARWVIRYVALAGNESNVEARHKIRP